MSVMYREPSIIKKSKDGRVAAVDMASELLNSRVLLLEGEVNDVTCNGIIKSMLVLEHQSATEPITLIINSPGGSVTAGLALIDTMQSLDCPVITVGEGVVASMAAVILACGDHRQVYRHAQVLIHQLMGGTGMAQQTDIEIVAQHTAAMRAELDELYGEIVKNLNAQARVMGYHDYSELSYVRMNRIGYGPEEIRKFRDQVANDVVPQLQKVMAMRAKRTGIARPTFTDLPIMFKDGNPKPIPGYKARMDAARTMYHELSPETAEFIDFMQDNELFDVESRPGKMSGGYMTSLPSYKAPFIFANWNNTSGDVDVLTHECGHAFEGYVAERDPNVPADLECPAMESAEIHSMAMEFLTAPWHHLLFGKDTEKYALLHAEDSFVFLAYGCAVDEFQHIMYQNPDLTPDSATPSGSSWKRVPSVDRF